MKNPWTADITADGNRNFQLQVELLEDDLDRGILYQDESGVLCLRFYAGPGIEIPAEWLVEKILKFKNELKQIADQSD